jgi:HK97 family phage major capsid protein
MSRKALLATGARAVADPTDDEDEEEGAEDGRATAGDLEDVLDGGADEEEEDEEGQKEARALAAGPRYRSMSVEIDQERMATRAQSDTRVPVCFSSEQPVMRFDWWEGERYLEVLDHQPSSIDMSYARNGLPFILDHDTGEQVGIVEEITFGDDRRGRGMLKLSRSARGQEIGQDIADGIRRNLSFGYTASDTYTQTGGEEEGAIPTRRYLRWTPMEVSSVAIPADVTVGVGRSADFAAHRRRKISRVASQARENTVSDKNTPAGGAAAAPPAVNVRNAEALEIRRMCRQHNVPADVEDSFYERGLTRDQIAGEILAGRAKSVQSLTPSATEQLDITRGDAREYVLGRALQALVTGDWKDAGYEREVSQALSTRLNRNTQGILVPTGAMTTRTSQSAGTAANGGNTVPTQMQGSLIELLRNKSVIDRMGPMRLSGLQGNVPIPRQTGAGTAGTQAELAGAFAESNMTFDQVTLSPKNILATESYSKQLFAQSIFAIDALVREDLTSILALLYDLQGLHGSGAGANMTGIYAQAGINSVAFGGAITYAKLVDMEAALEAGNAALGNFGYVTTPEVKGTAKKTLEFAVNGASKIWTGTADEGEMNGYRAMASNQLSKTLGTGGDHGIIFGSWNQAIVADWGAIDITVDPFSRAREAVVNITAHWLADFALRHGGAFCKGTTLVP